jgi:hypothetical protein
MPEVTAAPTAGRQAAPAFTDPNADPVVQQQAGAGGEHKSDYWGKGWAKEDGSLDHTAFDKAPDDLKPIAKDLGRYKSLDDILRAFKERGELAGKKGLFEPLDPKAGDKEKAERMAQIRKINGTPEKVEDFGLKRPENVPEQYWNQAAVDGVAKIMQEEGASPALAKRLLEASMADLQGRLEAQKKEQAAIFEEQDRVIREQLIKEGFDFPKGLEDAQRACRKFGLDPNSPFLKNASVFMAFSRVGRNIKEDTLITGATTGLKDAENMAPDEAGKRAESIARNPKDPLYNAYWNKADNGKPLGGDHPDHEKTVALVRRLNARLREGK